MVYHNNASLLATRYFMQFFSVSVMYVPYFSYFFSIFLNAMHNAIIDQKFCFEQQFRFDATAILLSSEKVSNASDQLLFILQKLYRGQNCGHICVLISAFPHLIRYGKSKNGRRQRVHCSDAHSLAEG